MKKHFGYYITNGKEFFHKMDALVEATKFNTDVKWNFNDEVFSNIDWKTPISETLPELYRRRALQLRNKYDYLSLFFSGGVDSTNILHSFIDNNILLDEVFMYKPKVLDNQSNPNETKIENLFSEIDYAAIPHLKEYLKDSRTKVRVVDLQEPAEKFLSNPKLVQQYPHNDQYIVHWIAKVAMCLLDDVWNELYKKGIRVGHLQGVDKPIIHYNEGNPYFQFTDGSISFMTEPVFDTPESELIDKYQHHELFYWTPDVPELVIKQCQLMKELCETNEHARNMFMLTGTVLQDKFTFLNDYIYPKHVNSVRNRFHTVKNGLGLNAGQTLWFYKYMSKPSLEASNNIIKRIQETVDERFFMSKGHYSLDAPPAPSDKTIVRTAKSKRYYL